MIKNIRAVLTENENILYDARVHWIIFGNPIFYGLIGILIWLFSIRWWAALFYS